MIPGLKRLSLMLLLAGPLAYADSVHRVELVSLFDETQVVDFLWQQPAAGDGPWPAILFVHGFQLPDPNTGRPPGVAAMLEVPPRYPLFEIFREKGYLVAAVSQAGYGATGGAMDFCGPESQQAIATAVAALRQLSAVDTDRVYLHGRSRGAMASSMAATRELGVAGVILESGVYDLEAEYERLRSLKTEPYIYIAANIEREAGTSAAAFRERSLLLNDLSISAPVLLLQGADDRNTPIAQAIDLRRHLRDRGANVRLVAFPDEGHGIDPAKATAAIESFIEDVREGRRLSE